MPTPVFRVPVACRFTVCKFYNDTDILAQTGGKVNMRICAEAADWGIYILKEESASRMLL